MRGRRKESKGIVILLLIAVVVGAAAVFLAFQLRTDAVAESIRVGEPIAIAFLVSDGDLLLFTEILMYHPGTSKAALFDIPGEWGDVIESVQRMDRIDVIYRPGGSGPYLSKVEELLGLDVGWYVEMDLEQVESAVDILGGLDMFIANPVEIIGDVTVLLPSGSIVLDGAKVVEFISYDDPGEPDLDRRARYQKFVDALVKRIARRTTHILNDAIFGLLRDVIVTNMGSRALRSFVEEMGTITADYIVPKQVHGDRVIVDDQVLLFPHFDGNLIRESVRQTLVSLASLDVVGEDDLTVVLKVLNGTGINGLGSRTTQLFGDFGYDVMPASNADRADYEFSIIIGNSNDISDAQQVANLIRCSRVELAEDLGPDANVSIDERADVTIILGKDFDGRYCQ